MPEQLTTGLIEIQSTAYYPLYLPAGWEVATVRDCHFVPHGPPRLVPCQQRVGVTADIRCLDTGHTATVNQCRLKFLEAIPQHALHLKHVPRAVFL